LADLQRLLPPGTVYVAPSLADDEWYVLVVSPGRPARVVRGVGPVTELEQQLQALRGCLDGQLARFRAGLPVGPHERAELDAHLDALGRGPLGAALFQALDAHPPGRLVWVPDGPLHGLPVHALRRDGRYLVADWDVVGTFSGALFVHQGRTR